MTARSMMTHRCTSFMSLGYDTVRHSMVGFPTKKYFQGQSQVRSDYSYLSKYLFTGKKLTNKFDMTGKCILYGLQPNKL
jgi:hypothetical protein